MTADQIKIGDKVKVTDSADAQVYTITKVTRHAVQMQYTNAGGRIIKDLWADVSMLVKA
jgi:hypothetical protein